MISGNSNIQRDSSQLNAYIKFDSCTSIIAIYPKLVANISYLVRHVSLVV